MAEINDGASRHDRKSVYRQKKLSTRVDLTPMVDLGFLLITFFIFTTTLSQPTAMKLIMPSDKGTQMPVAASGALTLMPVNNDQFCFYEGFFAPEKIKFLRTGELRQLIIDKKHTTSAENFFIVIKPAASSSLNNLVDILDEMTINGIKRYALSDLLAPEASAVALTTN